MATIIRPEVSKKNKYWIDKHRYYELKHFCLQYLEWKKSYSEISLITSTNYERVYIENRRQADMTSKLAEERLYYFDRMEMVEQSAIKADAELASYILKAVTEGLSYTYLKSRLDIPCCRDVYYDRYRRFFWVLSKLRG